MQIAKSPNGALSPSQGSASSYDIQSELQEQRKYHRRVRRERSVSYWWPRVLLFFAAILTAALAAPYISGNTRTLLTTVIVVLVVLIAFKYFEVGFFLTAIVSTAWMPKVTNFGTLDIYPSMFLIIILFWMAVVRVAFRVDGYKPIFPSIRMIWPQVGLIFLAVVSEITIQYNWIDGVSHVLAHKYLSTIIPNPVIYDEILGVWMYTIPLTIILLTVVAINRREKWIEYTQRMIMMLGLAGAIFIVYEFRRQGGNVSTFRSAEPSILWMTLRCLSQLLVQACIIAYARFLYATRKLWRVFYLVIVAMLLIGIYVSLQNSWWVEVAVGLVAMTFVYSRRLLFTYFLGLIPLTPLIIYEGSKLASAKKSDLNRFNIWRDALNAWTHRPIFGFGPGNYWVFDQFYTTLARNLRNFTVTGLGLAHNGYLQVLVELGPAGDFFYIASTVMIAIAGYRLYKRYLIPRKKYVGGIKSFVDLGLAIDPNHKDTTPDKGLPIPVGLFGRITLFKMWLKGLMITTDGVKNQDRPTKETFDYFLDFIVRIWYVLWGVKTDEETEKRRNCMLGLVVFGLIIGSAFGDITSSSFFLPPRQLNQFVETPQVVVTWMLVGFVLYKDALWRLARKRAAFGKTKDSGFVAPAQSND